MLHLMNDRDVPSFHDDNPIADETAILQLATPVSRLRHHYLGLDFERLRAGVNCVRGKEFALMGDKVRETLSEDGVARQQRKVVLLPPGFPFDN